MANTRLASTNGLSRLESVIAMAYSRTVTKPQELGVPVSWSGKVARSA